MGFLIGFFLVLRLQMSIDRWRFALDQMEICCTEWHEACLQFHQRDNAVRTASVWQVRQPLHRNRMGRWQHYEPFLRPVLGDALDQV